MCEVEAIRSTSIIDRARATQQNVELQRRIWASRAILSFKSEFEFQTAKTSEKSVQMSDVKQFWRQFYSILVIFLLFLQFWCHFLPFYLTLVTFLLFIEKKTLKNWKLLSRRKTLFTTAASPFKHSKNSNFHLSASITGLFIRTWISKCNLQEKLLIFDTQLKFL